jgi:hypothetical protein
MMKPKSIALFAALAAALALANEATAAIIYSTPGSTYSQNFDTLPNTPTDATVQASRPWNDDTTQTASNTSIPGWYLYHVTSQAEGGANMHQRIRFGAGAANTGSFWSYGSAGSAERALGSLASNTTAAVADGGEQYIGLRLTNDTGRQLASFTLSFTGEQWRDGGAAAPGSLPQILTFGWKVNAANLQDTGFTPETVFDFTSPSFGGTATGATAARDGNAVANRTLKGPVTISGLNWQDGQDLWLRWTDINDSGNDHALAIDDLEFSADVPEPASLVLIALAIAGACGVRRSR